MYIDYWQSTFQNCSERQSVQLRQLCRKEGLYQIANWPGREAAAARTADWVFYACFETRLSSQHCRTLLQSKDALPVLNLI